MEDYRTPIYDCRGKWLICRLGKRRDKAWFDNIPQVHEMLRDYSFYAHHKKNTYYVETRMAPRYKCQKFHTLLYEKMFGRKIPKGHVLDHEDGRGYNNTLRNLRLATISMNNVNTHGLRSDNTTGLKGITKTPRSDGSSASAAWKVCGGTWMVRDVARSSPSVCTVDILGWQRKLL